MCAGSCGLDHSVGLAIQSANVGVVATNIYNNRGGAKVEFGTIAFPPGGAGVRIVHDSTVHFARCRIHSNHAETNMHARCSGLKFNAGGVFIVGRRSGTTNVHFKHCHIYANTATLDGGAIYTQATPLTVVTFEDCQIYSNQCGVCAWGSGGAMYLSGGTHTFRCFRQYRPTNH